MCQIIARNCLTNDLRFNKILIFYFVNPAPPIEMLSTISPFLEDQTHSPFSPESDRLCNPIAIASINFDAQCFASADSPEPNQEVPCTRPANIGTRARLTCKPGYASQTSSQQILTCAENGRWSPQPIPCTQTCGHEPINEPTSVRTHTIGLWKVPWHATIYRKKTYKNLINRICGGSIISPNVVISAKRCFWDDQKNTALDESQLVVTAGEVYHVADNVIDTIHDVQVFAVDKIQHFENEKKNVGARLSNEIAAVVLKTFIKFTERIAPICVDFNSHHNEMSTKPQTKRRLPSWGNSSGPLEFHDLSLVNKEHCITSPENEFASADTIDSLCLLFLNSSKTYPNKRDFGAGLVFPKKEGTIVRYYLRGILRAGPDNFDYENESLLYLFTDLTPFSDFVKQIVQQNEFKVEGIDSRTWCQVYGISHGFVTRLSGSDEQLNVGDAVRNYGKVKYGCERRFFLEGETITQCVDGFWDNDQPKCVPVESDSGKAISENPFFLK